MMEELLQEILQSIAQDITKGKEEALPPVDAPAPIPVQDHQRPAA
jgi:hypothetical protein